MPRVPRAIRRLNGHIPDGETADQAWWAQGDAPVRVAETVVPLVDGRATMLALAAAALTARERIWLADWDLHVQLTMVRGRDQRAGRPPGLTAGTSGSKSAHSPARRSLG